MTSVVACDVKRKVWMAFDSHAVVIMAYIELAASLQFNKRYTTDLTFKYSEILRPDHISGGFIS